MGIFVFFLFVLVSFVYLLDRYFLGIYYVFGFLLGIGDIKMRNYCF